MGIIIKSFSHFIPEQRVTNTELAKRYNISEEWIEERTGIKERRYATDDATSDMIVKAALQCLKASNLEPTDIDCIIVATMTPDYYCPSTAAIVHKKLETKNAWGFDIMAACSGFIYGLQLANAMISNGTYKNILLCGADKMSSCIDPNDRKTVLVLADGAGVTLLQYSETENNIKDVVCKLDSSNTMDITILTGGSKSCITQDNILLKNHFLRFNDKRIFEHVISLMESVTREILEKNKMTFDDIDFIVPHQANKRIIEVLAERVSLPMDKFIVNVEHIGNTSAATIPIAISEALENGNLKGNEKLLLVSVGAGFTYGASLIQLNID